MTVISVSVTQSAEEVVSGIPRFITISTNVMATIFYTLDGSDPTLFSNIYTDTLQLPTNLLKVTLKILATNGTDSSPIVSNTYQTVELGKNARTPHSGTNAQANAPNTSQNPYPFGTNPIQPNQIFLGAGEAGLTVDNPLLPETSTGFNGQFEETGFVNEPLIGIPTETQPIIYSESNAIGERGPGIGTLPPNTVQKPVPPPEQQNFSDKLFDPRALVIFQDFTKPNDPNIPVEINRQFFSLQNVNVDKQGANLFNSVDTAGPTGSFLRQHYNPTDQTLTYYYFDSSCNRWIISKTAYTPNADDGKYYNMVFSREKGAGFVFKWVNFKANYLF